MKVLFIAPQPFFIERGSPIAIKLVLDEWDRRGDDVDLVCLHEGSDVAYENVRLHRIPQIPGAKKIGPGFSLKKIICDFAVVGKALRLASKTRYDVVHAVEEGVFIALLINRLYGIPYVYDMDSSMADQLVEQRPILRVLSPFFRWFEKAAVLNAATVLPVCDALDERVKAYGAKRTTVLYDVPMHLGSDQGAEDLRQLIGSEGSIALYVGNLEAYQGIDLLLDSIALLDKNSGPNHFVLIGGIPEHIQAYTRKAESLGIGDRVHLLGPRPLKDIYGYLLQADVLVSPRTKGYNTPMKIYSYLASGRPVVATRLWTHTQVLDDETAMLAEPTPAAFADALREIARDADLRDRIGEAGKARVESRYSLRVFRNTLNKHFEWLERLVSRPSDGTPHRLVSR